MTFTTVCASTLILQESQRAVHTYVYLSLKQPWQVSSSLEHVCVKRNGVNCE